MLVLSLFVALLLTQAPCPAGWAPLASDACLLRGDAPGVIVYFHGMMAPSAKAFGWELSFLGVAPKKKRSPVVVLRGTPGLCDWSSEYTQWWCWPSVRARLPEVSATMKRLGGVLATAGQALGRSLPAPLLVGYSNGGYFLTLVMGDTRVRASGYVVINAGLVKDVSFAAEQRAPTLLISGAADAIQRPAMESLRATLNAAGWAPTWFLRDGSHPPELVDFGRVLDFASTLEWQPSGE